MMLRRGFTLVEVVIVSALILLGSLVAFHTAEVVSQREKEERLRFALLEMRAALDSFFQDSFQNPAVPVGEKPRFPKTIVELLTTKRPVPYGSFYLRRLPLNSMLASKRWQLIGNNGATEELKTINDETELFADVSMNIVDVRCPAPEAGDSYPANGLNGIPYNEW